MIVLRWILGVLGGLLTLATVFSFALAIGFDNKIWLERTRGLRRWLWLLLMFWFNTEVWGSVVRTLWNWNRGGG